jgi:hypothetical protein
MLTRSHGKSCTRSVALRGYFTHTDIAGANSFHFSGRLNRRSLPPAAYKLTASPRTVDGTTGTAASVSFRIKR